MNIILPLDPQTEEYNYISHMSKEEMIFETDVPNEFINIIKK